MSDISKVNLRIKRMWEFTGGDDPTLDAFKNALENLYGHDIVGAPVVHTTEVEPEQRAVLDELVQSYLDSPYSTKLGYKAMVNKGFHNFAETEELTEKEVVGLARVFKAPIWDKIREMYFKVSESEVDAVQEMINADVPMPQIKKLLKEFVESPNPDKSLRSWVDNLLEEKRLKEEQQKKLEK